MDNIRITDQSQSLFLAYARDAGNWSGTPCVGANVCELGEREDRGNRRDRIQLAREHIVERVKDQIAADPEIEREVRRQLDIIMRRWWPNSYAKQT